MEYQDMVAAIQAGRVKPVYLLHGPDAFQQEAVVQALIKTLPEAAREFDLARLGARTPLVEVLDQARTYPLFAERRVVIVSQAAVWQGEGAYRGRAGETLERDEAALEAYLQAPAAAAVLVFRQPAAVDRRRRLYKKAAAVGAVLEAKVEARPEELLAWSQVQAQVQGGALSREAGQLLLARVPPDLGRLDQELQKLLAYSGGKTIDRRAVEVLVTPSVEEEIWSLVEELGRGGAAAARRVRKLLEQGEHPLGILAFLAGQFRLILQAQALAGAGLPSRQVAAELKQHPFAVQRALERGRLFPERRLLSALQAIWHTEVGIKSGRTEPETALEQLMAGIAAG